MKNWLTLSREFWAWVGIGFAIVIIAGLILSKTCSVTSEPLPKLAESGPYQKCEQEQAGAKKRLDAVTRIAVSLDCIRLHLDEASRLAERRAPYELQREPEISLCKTKVADLALIFFTYCLVVVGYFTIRRSERNVRDLERAIILGGPTIMVTLPDGTFTLTSSVVANGSEIGIGVQNYGRTPGLVKKVYVQFSDIEPSGSPAIYAGGECFALDVGIYPTPSPQGFRAAPFHSPYQGRHFCFGYVEYEDMFRQKHTSRFCTRIEPGTQLLEIAGSQAYNDWD